MLYIILIIFILFILFSLWCMLKCAKIAEYVTGYKFRTCLNYMSKRDASVHEKEMIELRTKLENIGIKW